MKKVSPLSQLCHKAQASDVEVQSGPRTSVIFDPTLTAMFVTTRIDNGFDIGEVVEAPEADHMLLGVGADDTVLTSGGYGDVVK